MRLVVLLIVFLGAVAEACNCSDCGGFFPSYISFLQVTVRDSSARGIRGAMITLSGTAKEQLDTGTTDSAGVAVLTHIMFENPESATVVVRPPVGTLLGATVRALLQGADTTHVGVTLGHP